MKFRVVILKKKKCCTLHVVPNYCWTPIQKFHVLMLPLSFENLDWTIKSPQKNCWSKTKKLCQNFTLRCSFLTYRRASENFYCYPKITKTLHKPATGGNVFFEFFFIKWNSKKNLVRPCTDQKQFWQFLENKNEY